MKVKLVISLIFNALLGALTGCLIYDFVRCRNETEKMMDDYESEITRNKREINRLNKEIDKAKSRDEKATPCDLCRFNPPSSGDGKPCTMCPAN